MPKTFEKPAAAALKIVVNSALIRARVFKKKKTRESKTANRSIVSDMVQEVNWSKQLKNNFDQYKRP